MSLWQNPKLSSIFLFGHGFILFLTCNDGTIFEKQIQSVICSWVKILLGMSRNLPNKSAKLIRGFRLQHKSGISDISVQKWHRGVLKKKLTPTISGLEVTCLFHSASQTLPNDVVNPNPTRFNFISWWTYLEPLDVSYKQKPRLRGTLLSFLFQHKVFWLFFIATLTW